MPVKKKKKKIKKSSVSKQPRRGLQNLNVGFVKNPYSEAAKVKSWKELEKFISIHTPALGPAGVAYAATKFSMDNYNELKICYECEDAVRDLIEACNIKGGAVKIWKDYDIQTQRPYKRTGPLAEFILETQYACPRIPKTFQEHMTKFKEFIGVKRSKKQSKLPMYKDKEFKI